MNDPLEHEADRVADQVMRMPDPALSVGAGPLQVSRKCAACEEDKQKAQMKPASASGPQTGGTAGVVHDAFQSQGQPIIGASGGHFEPQFGQDFSGRPLDRDTQVFMQSRFGRDFANVRIHTGEAAAQSAAGVGARAYTLGRNVVFGEGRGCPGEC